MKKMNISDVTIKAADSSDGFALSFKEKLDLAKLLDRLCVSVIEVGAIEHIKTDSLLLKSLAVAVEHSVLAAPVGLNKESVTMTAQSLAAAAKFRLQLPVPVSPVQMEYICHQKPAALLETITEMVTAAKAYTPDVEFMAFDATRAEKDFLYQAIATAITAGATTVTICDTAGQFLPEEFAAFITEIKAAVPDLKKVNLGVACANDLALADACVIAALNAGVDEIKVAACGDHIASLSNIARVLEVKGEALGLTTDIRRTELNRTIERIVWLCRTNRSNKSPFDNGVKSRENEDAMTELNSNDDLPTVLKAVEKLGYDLSKEDGAVVYEAFSRIVTKKETVGVKELEAIVASAALQVPPTYRVESYVINCGNIITATAHIKLWKEDKLLEGISTGDGPVDASFLAIEQIVGHHYELDDFQIQAVTEGREAMGETIVKLRADGKLYSGRGISTDIIGSTVRAYVNALNKIVYEED